jgi:hypothetical protein
VAGDGKGKTGNLPSTKQYKMEMMLGEEGKCSYEFWTLTTDIYANCSKEIQNNLERLNRSEKTESL